VTFAVISTQNSSMNEGRDFKKLEKGRRYKWKRKKLFYRPKQWPRKHIHKLLI
jgi:hypothetical protein